MTAVVRQFAARASRPPANLLEPQPSGVLPANQARADERQLLIAPALRRLAEDGISLRAAAQWLWRSRGGQPPSVPTLMRWLSAAREGSTDALVPAYRGRPPAQHGWEVRAWQLYQSGAKFTRTTVAEILREEGHDSATDSRVNRFFKRLPKTLTDYSPARIGRNFHRDNVAAHKERDHDSIEVGEEWVSDGHRLKVLCRNATTGDLYRLELTPILDVRSNFLISWWWSRAESAETTVYAFCSAMRACGQVPVWFYTDNGSGFANQTMEALLKELGVRPVRGLPGHKKGRGFGEGFHRLVIEKFAKRFGDAFCGEARTDDALTRARARAAKGQIAIPTDLEVMEQFKTWAANYNRRPQKYSKKLNGAAPADLLPRWKQNPLHIPVYRLVLPWVRPQDPPTVIRASVRFENRTYSAGFLMQHERLQVRVRYDRFDESRVWAYDLEGRYLGEVPLIDKAPHVAASIAEDDRERSRLAANARDLAKIDRRNENYRFALDAPMDSPAIALLDQGHSLIAMRPALPRRAPAAPPSAENLARMGAELVEVSAVMADHAAATRRETPEQRFGRALALQARRDTGEAIAEADERWLATYSRSAECQGLSVVYEAFGYLPGLDEQQTSEGPAGTGPVATTEVPLSTSQESEQ